MWVPRKNSAPAPLGGDRRGSMVHPSGNARACAPACEFGSLETEIYARLRIRGHQAPALAVHSYYWAEFNMNKYTLVPRSGGDSSSGQAHSYGDK